MFAKNMANNKSYTASSIKRLISLIKQDSKEVYYIYVYAIFGGVIALTLPLGVQAIIGIISSQQITTSWGVIIFLISVGIGISGFLQIQQLSIVEILQQKLFARAAFDFVYRIPRFKVSAVDNLYPPELINRFFDIINIQKGLQKIILDFVTASVTVLFSLILLAFFHPLFLVFGIIFVSILIIIFKMTFDDGLQSSIQESNYKYQTAAWLQESARLFRMFKIKGDDDYTLEKTNSIVNKYIDAREKHFNILKIQFKSEIVFKIINSLVVLTLGSYLVINKQINIGQFVAVELVVLSITNSVEKAILSMSTLFDTLTALEKVGMVADIAIEKTGTINVSKEIEKSGIQLQTMNLAYKFADSEKYIFKNLNITMEKGKNLMINGINGSGKATLFEILSGMRDDYEGTVAINDVPFKNVDIYSYRKQIAGNILPQMIFEGTILDNLRYANIKATINEIKAAALLTGLNDLIVKQVNGYDTFLHVNTVKLSRELQTKIVFTRWLIQKPKLILIDEKHLLLNELESKKLVQIIIDELHNESILYFGNSELMSSLFDAKITLSN